MITTIEIEIPELSTEQMGRLRFIISNVAYAIKSAEWDGVEKQREREKELSKIRQQHEN